MTTTETTDDDRSLGRVALERDARELLGHVLAFVAGFRAYGYATRRDVTSWGHPLSWAPEGATR